MENNWVFSTLLNAVSAHIYWKDKEGRYLGCNQQQAKSLGLSSPNEIIGQTDFDLSEKSQAELYRKYDKEVFNSGMPRTMEEEVTISGVKHTMMSLKTPLKDPKGKIVGILGISMDITDRKKVEEDLKEAVKKADLANKAKTDFLQNMRHDLRTSLSGIEGFSGLIQKQAKDEKIKDYADDLAVSCRTLSLVLNQILHAIYAFSGDDPVRKNKFDLRGKLDNLVNLNKAKAGEKGIELTVDCDSKLPKYLIGDCKRLTGIVLELMTNALKYTETGQVAIQAKLERKEGNKVIIRFSVTDTGIGIAEDKKEEIFTQFTRLHPTYEGRYAGLGLGLSIVKQSIDDLGGEIYVDSEVGKGSTFTCLIPFIEPLSQDDIGVKEQPLTGKDVFLLTSSSEIKACPSHGKTSAQSKSGKNIILLVEDDLLCSKVASETLQRLGYNVELAWNGEEALQKALSKSYALIFMDIGLPDINGNEVTRKIRIAEKSTNTHTPIIVLSAHVEYEDKQQSLKNGADAVLSKPMRQEKVADMLQAFILSDEATKPVKVKKKRTDEALLVLDGEVLDYHYLKNDLGYSNTGIKEVLILAKQSIAKSLTAFQKAYKDKEFNQMQAISHKMGGGAIYSGAVRLSTACKRLEDYLRKKKTKLRDRLAKLVIEEAKLFQRVIENIQ